MLGSLAWFLWPSAHWQPQAEPLAALLTAILAWVYVTFLSAASDQPRVAPHPHDLALFDRFNATIPEGQRAFLREHNFRNQYKVSRITGLMTFVDDWHGADFEFHDRKVQRQLELLFRSAFALMELITSYTYTTDDNVEVVTPLTDADRANGISEQTRRQIKEMNEALH